MYLSSDFLNDNSVGEFVIDRGSLFHNEQEKGTKEYKKALLLAKGWRNNVWLEERRLSSSLGTKISFGKYIVSCTILNIVHRLK